MAKELWINTTMGKGLTFRDGMIIGLAVMLFVVKWSTSWLPDGRED